ncbi:hypothetical protein [Micromonospora sp. CA-246542]|uniref:hypothetical protein n=1 Tax=Micromonospora sp. CA-246542 TaxID=3239959 RepID=UPI003D90F035
MSPAEITALTPRAKDVAALRGEVDPTGKFGNELSTLCSRSPDQAVSGSGPSASRSRAGRAPGGW